MSTAKTPSPRVIDAACVIVVAATIAMFVVNESSSSDVSAAPTILAIAVAKSIVISAAFMGLLWTSRLLFALISVAFIALGLLLVAMLT